MAERYIKNGYVGKHINFTPEQDDFLATLKNRSHFVRWVLDNNLEFKEFQKKQAKLNKEVKGD